MRLRSRAGLNFSQLALDRLPIFLHEGTIAAQLYEQMIANGLTLVVQPAHKAEAWQHVIDASAIRPWGFDDTQALLPYTFRSFHGYRLLQEYFAFPERFLFVELTELRPAVEQCKGNELDFIFLFNRSNPRLVSAVGPSHFHLFCTPAINLFPRNAPIVFISRPRRLNITSCQIVPDRWTSRYTASPEC